MRSRFIAALAGAALLVGAAVVPPAQSAPGNARPQAAQGSSGRTSLDEAAERLARMGRPMWVPGEVVVEFRPGVGRGRALGVLRERGLSVARRMPRSGLHVARVPRGRPVARAAAELRSHPQVRDASPNLLRYLQAPFVPDDPLFDQQWGLLNIGQEHGTSNPQLGTTFQGTTGADIKATEAWDTQQGRDDVVVAVLDTGVDTTHPDITGNLWVNEDEAPDGQDNDENGCIDDIHGCDFTTPTPDGSSLFHDEPAVFGFDHGTHVAGTIAAVTNNDTGVAGACPSCKLMVLKAARPRDIDINGETERVMVFDLATLVEALDYAAEMQPDVLNASLGAPILWSGIERRAFLRVQRAGVLSVIAAGNERGDNDRLLILSYTLDFSPDVLSPIYPASYRLPGIISVAASNSRDEYGFVSNCPAPVETQWRCAFTNWGVRSVHLAAPGVDVISTVPTAEGPDYAFFDGTSMAAPHVAGVAGLVKSENPEWSHLQIKQAILDGVDETLRAKELKAFPTQFFGLPPVGTFVRRGGRLDAAQAIAGDGAGWIQPRTRHDINGARRIRLRRQGRVRWPGNTNHVYKRRLLRGQRWRAILTGLDGQDVDLHVWRPATREIWQIEEGCFPEFFGPGRCPAIKLFEGATPSSREVVTFRAPRTGVYFFHVSAFVLEEGSYRLRLRRCTRPAPRC